MNKHEFLAALKSARRNSFGWKFVPNGFRIKSPNGKWYVHCHTIAVPHGRNAISGIFEQVWLETEFDGLEKIPVYPERELLIPDKAVEQIRLAVTEQGAPRLRRQILNILKMKEVPPRERQRHAC